jgi:subtilisin-like proprotein convertase family protein
MNPVLVEKSYLPFFKAIITTKRTTMRLGLLSIALMCLFASTGFADVTGNSGNDGGAIPDNTPAGYVSTVTITDSEIIEDAKFSIEGLTHSWIGDLIITISHSTSGKSATLMHRVGTTSHPNSVGDSSDVNGTYMFQDGNASIWSEAGNGDTDYVVNPGVYAASGVNEAFVSLNTLFGGELTNGDWTFTISDNNATQTGAFLQTSVEFVSSIPEPGTMAIVVVGTLFGGVLLRRRHQKKLKSREEKTA